MRDSSNLAPLIVFLAGIVPILALSFYLNHRYCELFVMNAGAELFVVLS